MYQWNNEIKKSRWTINSTTVLLSSFSHLKTPTTSTATKYASREKTAQTSTNAFTSIKNKNQNSRDFKICHKIQNQANKRSSDKYYTCSITSDKKYQKPDIKKWDKRKNKRSGKT